MDAVTVILTAAPESGRIALDEIQQVDPTARLIGWLAPGVGRVDLAAGWPALAAAWSARPPIFCRHVCPAQVIVPLTGTLADLDRLETAAAPLLERMDPAHAFSVQTRLLGPEPWPYGRYEVNERLAGLAQATGAPLDVRRPAQVLSVVGAAGEGCLGLSWAADNLSDWAGGERRFKRGAGQISRAEFKLLEALELFRLTLPTPPRDAVQPTGGLALDLGAAPGGWTRLLRRQALRVIAVDPADLHPLVAGDPAVTHWRGTAQAYLARPPGELFDVILDDMRIDARDAARLMLRAADRLRPDGLALMTLKLPGRGLTQTAHQALDLLRQRFQILGARQLFHNRLEITVALRLQSRHSSSVG